jgi:hypothetical protein
MDQQRLDSLARSMASMAGTRPRRQIIGGLMCAVTSALTLPGSALACQRVGQVCDKFTPCCPFMRCRSGLCRCRRGLHMCPPLRRCHDLSTDPQHCGACDNFCKEPAATCCDGTCVDLNVHRDHCGSCGHTCADGETCTLGICTPCLEGDDSCGPVCPACSPT